MCGRFTLKTPVPEIARLFDARPPEGPELGPRFNIAPTDPILGVRRAESDGREIALFHWGLIPAWVKDPKDWPTLINARAETLDGKPAFEEAFRFRRCLVVADGFYEWRSEGGIKQPYYVRRQDEEPLAFAGLWDRWRGTVSGETEEVESATIVTTDANELLRRLHDRMPVILTREGVDRWLDPEVHDREPLEPLLRPAPSEDLVAHPVSRRVSRPDTEGPELIEPLEEDEEAREVDAGAAPEGEPDPGTAPDPGPETRAASRDRRGPEDVTAERAEQLELL